MVEPLPRDEKQGLGRACNDEKFAFMCAQKMYKSINEELKCQFVPLDVTATIVMTFDLAKNSPYLGLFNTQ